MEANLLTLSAWCHARFTMRGYAPLAEYVHGSQEMEGEERRGVEGGVGVGVGGKGVCGVLSV